ncbi:hypothetical protein [Streptomyces sp. SAS_272]|uniref:hypothetical protein n=1 Tax=Streptomyces sp. SAS_272 TaxID=3412747 RepID=UPI00403C9C0B
MRTVSIVMSIFAAALLTSCDGPRYDCEGAPLRPSPVAQAAPVAPDKHRPPRPTRPASKPHPTKPQPKSTWKKPKSKPGTTPTPTPHHDLDECDDD